MVMKVRTAGEIANVETTTATAPTPVVQLGRSSGPQVFVSVLDLLDVLSTVRASGARVDYRDGVWDFTFVRTVENGTDRVHARSSEVSRMVAEAIDGVREWAQTAGDSADTWIVRCATNAQLARWLGLPQAP